MRLLVRSATYNLPWESIAMPWGRLSSPGPAPFVPQHLINLPSLENFTTRVFVLSPSDTKISPLFDMTTSLGPLSASVESLSPATPFLPSVIRSSPSRLYLKTWSPVLSVIQMKPSRRTRKPCAEENVFSPHFLRNLP